MRNWLTLLGLMTISLGPVQAQTAYPTQPIHIIVPWGAGGATDTLARIIADELRKDLSQNVVVENAPGASGTVGAARVARAKPDGHTLLFTTNAIVINGALNDKLPFDVVDDLVPLSIVGTVANMLLVKGDSSYKTVNDYVDAARRDPGSLSYASSGSGTSTHLGVAQFEQLTTTNYLSVPYSSSSAMVQALLGGHVESTWLSGATITGFLTSGQLRALGTASAERSRYSPETPTFKELGIPFISETWFGFLGPAKLPSEVSNLLNTALYKILANPDAQTRMLNANLERVSNTALTVDELRKQIQDEVAQYKRLIVKVSESNTTE